ncbi:MAG: glycosyltransferase family 4 protein [Alicyclobacillus sp.]|nr:glycosyltransferase family 4 protein [Alicyclobacillus sp.]
MDIGILLMYDTRVPMDGEGIGRYVVRLTHGLLQHPGITVHVQTTPENLSEVHKVLRNELVTHPSRLLVHHERTIQAVNRNVRVSAWIVPYVGMAAAAELTQPFIVCLHDLIHRHFPDLYLANYGAFFRRIDQIAEDVVRRAAAVVFSSEFTRNHEGAAFLHLPETQMHVIRPASPTEEYSEFPLPPEPTFRAKYQLTGEYFVFPSAIRLHKNHDRLIEAFFQFRRTPLGRASNLQLVFTDHHTPGPKSAEIVTLLNRCPEPEIRNSVRFIGRLPANDVPSLYRYAAGTVVPTLFEGSCPFPILESLVMQTPVAVSDIAVAREVIPQMDAFLPFDPYATDQMARSIAALWRQGRQLVTRQLQVLAPALQRSWTLVAQEFLDIVRMVQDRG